MYVKIDFGGGYERTVECDTMHRSDLPDKTGFTLMLYRGGNQVESPVFTDESVDVFVVSDIGRTIDHIRYRPQGDQ